MGRLESLDVFRAATIAAMILVNNPGSWSAVYPPLRHAEWHGWTFTDLIFPFFLTTLFGILTGHLLRSSRGAAGMALNVFAVCYWVVDVKGYRRWARPFAIFGMYAIAVYVLAGGLEVVLDVVRVTGAVPVHEWVFQRLFAPLASPVNASLLWAVSFVAVMYLIAYGMYRRKWFVKV